MFHAVSNTGTMGQEEQGRVSEIQIKFERVKRMMAPGSGRYHHGDILSMHIIFKYTVLLKWFRLMCYGDATPGSPTIHFASNAHGFSSTEENPKNISHPV